MNNGFSIIVCTYNGINRIADTLDSIIKLKTTLDIQFELIVIDNNSNDFTFEFVEEYLLSKKVKFPFRIIKEYKSGLNYARISGLKNSTKKWVLFCDDDNILNELYLVHAIEIILKYPSLGALGGRGIVKADINLPVWFEKYSHSFAVGPQGKKSGLLLLGSALYGAGLIINKEPLLMMLNSGFECVMSDRKGNNLSSGGDVEWCYIIQLMKYQLFYSEDLLFYHKISNSRLEWNYYLKLKSGIASGVALLEPYRFLLNNSESGFSRFLSSYISTAFYLQLISVFNKFKKYIMYNSTKTIDWEIGYAIITAKAKSFRKNIFRSSFNFISIKKLLNDIN